MNDDRRFQPPIQPPAAASRIDVTVNVVVSGMLVVEFRSKSDAADLKKLTADLTGSDAKLEAAVATNPVPTP